MANKKAASAGRPWSRKDSAILAGLILLVVIGLLFVYAKLAPKLVQAGVQDQYYYVTLVVLGLVAALILSGILHGYAHVQLAHLGTKVVLSGATATAALVVLGGFWVVPHAETFDVTMRVYELDGRTPVTKPGTMTLDLGVASQTQPLGPDAEAHFLGIPHKFRGRSVDVVPHVDGYESKTQPVVLGGESAELMLVPEHPHTVLNGRIDPAPGKLKDRYRIMVEGQPSTATPDEYGRFTLALNMKDGQRARVQIYRGNAQLYDDYQTLPGPVILKLRRRR